MVNLRWISERIPDDRASAEEQILRELAEIDCDPMEILFHTVFIGGDYDGPCVSVTPSNDKTCMECYYDEDPEWIETGPLEEGPFAGSKVAMFDPKGRLDDESDS